MYIDWQTIVTAGAVVSALLLLLSIFTKGHNWFLNQGKQDEKIEKLKQHHEDDVQRIKQENYLICYALSACLDGLMQLKCNHTVPDAKQKLDEYLNQQAHE